MSERPARRLQKKHSAIVHVIIFSVIGAALWTAMLFLAAFLALQKDWNSTALTVSAYVCCALSAFACSFCCAKSAPERKALQGILSALPTLLLLAVLCLTMHNGIGGGFGVACLLIILCAALGGLLAIRRKTKKRYKKIGAVR